MGKTPRPLIILALPPVSEWSELEQLEKQGHTIFRITHEEAAGTIFNKLFAEADVILGANCWRMDHLHRRYLTDAISQARIAKYGEPKQRKKVGDSDATGATSSSDGC